MMHIYIFCIKKKCTADVSPCIPPPPPPPHCCGNCKLWHRSYSVVYVLFIIVVVVVIIKEVVAHSGLGLAFNLQPALTMIGKYFFKKRPIANGMAMAGSPVFLSTLAPFNQYLFNAFGWRGSFLILGGPAAQLLRGGGPHEAAAAAAGPAQEGRGAGRRRHRRPQLLRVPA